MVTSRRVLKIIALSSLLALAGILGLAFTPHPLRASSVSFTVFGRIYPPPTGWGFTSSSVASPGPDITVLPGETVSMSVNSGDGNTHNWGVDYNGNGVIDTGEPLSNNTATSTPYTFTATTTPGTYTYWCFRHKGPMFGNFVVLSPDFSISANPTTVGPLGTGATGTSTITISPINGFTGTVTLSLSRSLGLSAMPSSNSIMGGSGTSTLTVSASAPGSYNVNVTGTSGTLSHFVTVTVNVIGPDFTISANPMTIGPLNTAAQGTSTITITSSSSFAGTVALTTTPSTGLTAMVSPPSVSVTGTMAGTSTLTVSASAAGTYNVNVTGTSGSLSHKVKVTVYVGADFTIRSSQASLSINQGSSSTYTLTLQSLNGFSGSVSLAATATSGGPSATLNPSAVTLSPGSSGQSTVQVSTSSGIYSSTSTGTYTLNVTGTSGSISHSTTVTVTVTSGTSSGTGSLSTSVIVGIVVAIVAAVAVAILAVRRSRPKK